MGAASEVEMLQARAQFMRESLGKSRNVTETMISILGSFDNRLSSLETAMRPTQVRTTMPFISIVRLLASPRILCTAALL